MALPIEVNHHTVGVLACHRIRSRMRHVNDDMALLKILATLAGQILQLQDLMREKTRALETRNAQLIQALDAAAVRYGIMGTAPALLQALGELERVSQAQASVLLLGESGTGKELFARAVHLSSQRRDAPFIKVNCAAIPDTLFESELFGYERGAFTGANSARAGWFEQADRGSIFLDEIGDMPLAMQTKLLRTLQEGTVVRLGGKREIRVDVRLRVTTACGQRFVADQVIAAVGLQTPGRLAQGAGLTWKNGIAVEFETLRTSNVYIHALGDCITLNGEASRYIEPIARQAKTIAAAICGLPPAPYEARPALVRVKTTSLPLTLH